MIEENILHSLITVQPLYYHLVCLKTIDFRDNSIGHAGFIALATALQRSTGFTRETIHVDFYEDHLSDGMIT